VLGLARWILRIDRARGRAHRALGVARDEMLCALLDDRERAALTAEIYSQHQTFLPGGQTFRGGLFKWEEHALAHPLFPKQGRILIGGAGGGREMVALCERGYEVVAFEPSDLVSGAIESAARIGPHARALRGSYADLIEAVERGSGPLGSIGSLEHDAVVLGWASFAFVTAQDERNALLRALRRVCPNGPVLMSFLPNKEQSRSLGERWRPRLRRALRTSAPPELRFLVGNGFVMLASAAQIEDLAARNGYRVASCEEGVEAWSALLVPDRA
jgi:hypothetical protein